jgi:hypothetical protein
MPQMTQMLSLSHTDNTDITDAFHIDIGLKDNFVTNKDLYFNKYEENVFSRILITNKRDINKN